VFEVTLSKGLLATDRRLRSLSCCLRDGLDRSSVSGGSSAPETKAQLPNRAAQADHGATSSAFIELKNVRAKMDCVSTAASAPSCEKPLLQRVVFKGATGGRFFCYGCSERSGAWEIRSRRIGSSKVNHHNIVFTSNDIALSTSDRPHGTTPALLGLKLNGDEAVLHPAGATVRTRSWSPSRAAIWVSFWHCQGRSANDGQKNFLSNNLLI
jgi:hypothetical protein